MVSTTRIDVFKVGVNTYKSHMLFDWYEGAVSYDMHVIAVWHKGWLDAPSAWQTGGTAPAAGRTDTNDWQFAMNDSAWNGTDNTGTDGISGHRMWNGPFAGSYANFDFTKVPEPGTLLLLGTGLAGLIGAARRKPC